MRDPKFAFVYGFVFCVVLVAVHNLFFPERSFGFKTGYELGLLESCRDKVKVIAYQDGDSSVVQIITKD